ncbi:MAG TPA: DUF2239 family protein [Longimicrobiales bacterium]|nr:DUF2239 family protein [Longimicrobiales bacterium]
MDQNGLVRCSAFAGTRRIASGGLVDVAVTTKEVLDRGEQAPVLVFDDATGRPVELDLRGSPEDVRARALAQEGASADVLGAGAETPARGPGRPRLGVVSKEVTLLPRHWAWLGAQRGGASATLRRLVDQARKAGAQQDRVRQAQDAAFRFMSALAGDLPGFEEAIRALFARDPDKFDAETEAWPADVRAYSGTLAADAFHAPSPTA